MKELLWTAQLSLALATILTGTAAWADSAPLKAVSAEILPAGNVISLVTEKAELTAPDPEQLQGFFLTVNGKPMALGAVRIQNPNLIQAAIAGLVRSGDNVQLKYDGQDKVESAEQGSLRVFANLRVDNHSTQRTASGHKGSGVMSTRGFARTSALAESDGKEAITSYRFELPYGVSAGWKLPYLGFSDNSTETIHLKAVVVSIAQPDLPLVRMRVTFDGQPGTKVPPGVIVESDPAETPLLPGTVLTVATFFGNANPAGALPFMTWGFTDKMDGCLVGESGTLKEASLWNDSTYRGDQPPKPMWAGQNALIRSYQPMFVTGRPHPLYSGTEVVVGFIGDSINVAFADFGRAGPDDPYAARGWNGRACGTSRPYVIFGQGGSTAGGFIGAKGSPLFNYIFGTGADDRKITHVVDAYGINVLRQPTKTQPPDVVWLYRQQAADLVKQLGMPYIHTTLTPMTASWMNVTPDLGHAADQFTNFVAARKKFNEQVRHDSATIPGCIGFIDWGGAVEKDPAASDNTWLEGVSFDGIHPSAQGHQRMAGAVGNPFTTANLLPVKPSSAKK